MAQEMKILLVFIFMLNACYASYNAKIVEELKSNTGDVSLSINIPSLALSDILGSRKTNSETRENIKASSNESSNAEEKGSKSLDLAKLLSSGKPVSIKSTETSTMGEKGNTEKSVKEIAIDTLGDSETKSNNKEKEMQFDEKAISKLVPALKQALFNSNSNSNSSSSNLNIEEDKNNPSSGIVGDKTSKATESRKEMNDFKSLKGIEESKDLKGKEKGAEVSAAESKPASSEGSRPSKQNSITNQIALVPVSLPSSVLSQLQSAISGGGGGNEGNMSANSANSSTNIFPGLTSLLGAANNNNNNDNATANKEMANERKNDTNGESVASIVNETTSSMTNSSNAETNGREGAKIKKKKENEDRDSGGKSVATQSELSSNPSKPMKKDTPVLVVIPQITNAARDLTETKSGFFSKKSTSTRVRSGLHKKSKVQSSSHKKSKFHKHRHHY